MINPKDRLDSFVDPKVLELIKNEKNWSKEKMLNKCIICEIDFKKEEIPFHIFRDRDNEQDTMSFHFGCAFKESHSKTFEEDNINGWIDGRK